MSIVSIRSWRILVICVRTIFWRPSFAFISGYSGSSRIQMLIKNFVKCGNQLLNALCLTARQYGEVVLPDAASGQGPGTLARKLSRCKEGMARVFAVMVQILLRAGAIAVQV